MSDDTLRPGLPRREIKSVPIGTSGNFRSMDPSKLLKSLEFFHRRAPRDPPPFPLAPARERGQGVSGRRGTGISACAFFQRWKRLCHQTAPPRLTCRTCVIGSMCFLSSLAVRVRRFSRSYSKGDHRAQPPSTGQTRCSTMSAHPPSIHSERRPR